MDNKLLLPKLTTVLESSFLLSIWYISASLHLDGHFESLVFPWKRVCVCLCVCVVLFLLAQVKAIQDECRQE